MAERAEMFRAKLTTPNEVRRLLDAWEAATLGNLGLEELQK
jgi:hypothetical protein